LLQAAGITAVPGKSLRFGLLFLSALYAGWLNAAPGGGATASF